MLAGTHLDELGALVAGRSPAVGVAVSEDVVRVEPGAGGADPVPGAGDDVVHRRTSDLLGVNEALFR